MSKNHASDILFGMKAIVAYLGICERTVLKYCAKYSDYPVRKTIGKGWASSKIALDEWYRDFLCQQK